MGMRFFNKLKYAMHNCNSTRPMKSGKNFSNIRKVICFDGGEQLGARTKLISVLLCKMPRGKL